MFPVRTTQIALAALLVCLVAVAAPAPALASSASVIRDCSEDGILNGKYSQSELDGALEQLPSDLDEYTDCRSVIRRAQLGSAANKRGHTRKPSGVEQVDSGAPPSGDEQQEISKAAGSRGSVRIAGEGVRPGGTARPFDSAGFGTELPAFLLVVLLALAGLFLSALVLAARRRWPAAEGAGGPLQRLGEGVRRGISRFRR
jgi:hypothetical protein